MNPGRFTGGIICLALALLLGVLASLLPSDQFVVMVGDTNRPFVPTIVLAVVGVVLLATTRIGGRKTPQVAPPAVLHDPGKAALNKRLESIAWGCFLIMLGGFAFMPSEQVPKGLWSIGVGVIMLGLNAARYFHEIRMSGLTTVLGILSVLGGAFELLGTTSLQGGLLLIILGAYLILKPWFDRRQLFGKAEESTHVEEGVSR